MSEAVSVVLTGEILPGHTREEVTSALAVLLKTTESRAAAALSCGNTVLKRNVPAEAARRYIKSLNRVGAGARSRPVQAPPEVRLEREIRREQAYVPEDRGIATRGLELVPAQPDGPTGNTVIPETTCPKCGCVQPENLLCRECGCAMARVRAAQEAGEAWALGKQSPYSVTPGVSHLTDEDSDEMSTPRIFAMSTQGRLGRLRYLAYSWPILAAIAAAGILAALTIPKSPVLGGIVLIPAGIVAIWMSIRVLVMRLHDVNRSGKWILAALLLPGVAGAMQSPTMVTVFAGLFWIAVLVLFAWPGTKEANDYGPPCEPNTTWVYVGAGLFIVLQVLSVVGNINMASQGKPSIFTPTMKPATASGQSTSP
jgi:uncharacterized membrane protein YhaH (DUF805 family)